jgi:hypothetical protein
MVDGLSELVKACGAHSPTSPAERITEGETHWFIGYAAAAPAKMVALSQTETLKLIFRQEDVCEVRREGERFLMRVRDGANMLVSFEQVIKAGPTCVCGEGRSEGSKPGTMAKGIDVSFGNFGDCTIRIECSTVNIPLVGPTRVCVPTGFWCTRETNGQPS